MVLTTRGVLPRHAPDPQGPSAFSCRSRGSGVRPHTDQTGEWSRARSYSGRKHPTSHHKPPTKAIPGISDAKSITPVPRGPERPPGGLRHQHASQNFEKSLHTGRLQILQGTPPLVVMGYLISAPVAPPVAVPTAGLPPAIALSADRPTAQDLLLGGPHAGPAAVALRTTTKMSAGVRFIDFLPLRVDHVPLSRWHDRAETAAREPSPAWR
jgi:hypothetical protein